MQTQTRPEAYVTTLKQYVDQIEARAKALITPDLGDDLGDPQILHRRAEALVNLLAIEAADEATRRQAEAEYRSLLLTIPETDARWSDALNALLDRSRRAVAARDAQRLVPQEQPARAEAFAACEAARQRVIQACEGSEPKSAEAVARKEAVLGRRTFSPSKAAWENELRNIITAIRTPGPHQGPALRALIPLLEATLQRLEEVEPQTGGRPKKPVLRWSEEVVHAQTSLALVIDDLVRWSAAVAEPARNAAVLRIANPKRRGDEVGLADPAPRQSVPQAKPGGAEVLPIRSDPTHPVLPGAPVTADETTVTAPVPTPVPPPIPLTVEGEGRELV